MHLLDAVFAAVAAVAALTGVSAARTAPRAAGPEAELLDVLALVNVMAPPAALVHVRAHDFVGVFEFPNLLLEVTDLQSLLHVRLSLLQIKCAQRLLMSRLRRFHGNLRRERGSLRPLAQAQQITRDLIAQAGPHTSGTRENRRERYDRADATRKSKHHAVGTNRSNVFIYCSTQYATSLRDRSLETVSKSLHRDDQFHFLRLQYFHLRLPRRKRLVFPPDNASEGRRVLLTAVSV